MSNLLDSIHIAVLPLDIAEADKEANLNAVEAALASKPKETDIVVLPELFSTGYIASGEALRPLAEGNDGPTVARLRVWASKYQCAFCGSFLAVDGDRLLNRAFLIEPNSDETFYDKAHLFGVSSEAQILSNGAQQPPVIRFRGWNVSMIVCYDLRFPVWCRNTGLRYDLMLVPANWPLARENAWTTLLAARAIENQAIYVGADRGGIDSFGEYEGMTRCFNAKGQPAGQALRDTPWYTAVFSHAELDEYRKKFPAHADADSFTVSVKG